jgi:hypothetical protein
LKLILCKILLILSILQEGKEFLKAYSVVANIKGFPIATVVRNFSPFHRTVASSFWNPVRMASD